MLRLRAAARARNFPLPVAAAGRRRPGALQPRSPAAPVQGAAIEQASDGGARLALWQAVRLLIRGPQARSVAPQAVDPSIASKARPAYAHASDGMFT